uniref:DUF4408 domain-containing protein n=1 Tax=Ananas comosus var. bracteatus TaxID=296719 RepID=A0A6V7QDJ1_ANACO|nr:unnamed protein product [Ananas comosus var. bracteatus]
MRRKVRFPMEGEMGPARLRAGSSKATTLMGCLRLHATPSHTQKFRVPFHELSTSDFGSIIFLKASRAARSIKAAAASAAVVWAAVVLRLAGPSIVGFVADDLPRLYGFILDWLTPPYLYLVINVIILSIAASSRFSDNPRNPGPQRPSPSPLRPRKSMSRKSTTLAKLRERLRRRRPKRRRGRRRRKKERRRRRRRRGVRDIEVELVA